MLDMRFRGLWANGGQVVLSEDDGVKYATRVHTGSPKVDLCRNVE